jgi:aspartyl/asparaginyl beta-hydroxylase (cupin superfamily)
VGPLNITDRSEQIDDPRADAASRRPKTGSGTPPVHVPGRPWGVIRAELRRREAHLVRHRAQSLEQHLFNTFNILTAWNQPSRVRYAGLIHGAYFADAGTNPTFGTNERDHVRALVGEKAERLAYLFCGIDRRELLTIGRMFATEPTDVVTLPSRLPDEFEHLTRCDAGDLLALYMAHVAEQSCRLDGYPARWLARVSVLGRDARGFAEVTPPVFGDCTKVLTNDEEAQLLRSYERLVVQFGCAEDRLVPRNGQPYADWPFVGEPLVWLGLRAIVHGRPEDAATLAEIAADRLQRWGTSWDKRLTLHQWLQLCAAMCDTTNADQLAFVARASAEAVKTVAPSPERLYIQLDRAGLLPITEPIAAHNAQAPLPARFQSYISGLRTNHKKPRMTTYPGLRSLPWHDAQQFRLARDLEAAADKIAAEFHALAGRGFQDEAENIKRSGQWSVLFLYERGRKNEDICSRCPQTLAVIETNRTVLSLGGLAYFSALEPGTHVTPHYGPTNMRLRCHLGIDVPEGCGVRVGGTTRTWQVGRCIVFDDSFTHEVWNFGDRRRVVLVVDLWHPDLTDDEVSLLNGMHRYATATGTNLARYWSRNINRAKAGPTFPPESSARPEQSRT